VAIIQLPYAADALDCILVAELAAQGIARIGRIDDDAAVADDIDSLPDQPLLRIVGMDTEEQGHGGSAKVSILTASVGYTNKNHYMLPGAGPLR
jgi:hypothetical protein